MRQHTFNLTCEGCDKPFVALTSDPEDEPIPVCRVCMRDAVSPPVPEPAQVFTPVQLFQLTTTYACAGIYVSERVIVDAAPVFRKLIGKTAREIVSHPTYVCCIPV